MDKTRLVFGSLLLFTLGAIPAAAFGQAAAEAGLVSGLSSVSTTSAASGLSGATNRALQGHMMTGGKISRPAVTTAVHKTGPASMKVSAASTKSAHSEVATATDHGAKLPGGVAHVWPPDALSQVPAEPK
jgi:hypothetical protein